MFALAVLLAASPADYRALGTEPFWSLTIGRTVMRLEEPGRPTRTYRTPPARRIPNGVRRASGPIVVTIVRRACSDGMSDRTFPETVTVRIGARVLNGCGGAPASPPGRPVPAAW